MIARHIRPKRNPTVGTRNFDDATFLLDASHAKLHELNATGALIWSLCDGQHDLQTIANQVSALFDVSPEYALADLQRFVAILQSKELLSFEEK
ncbi:PqqD family protein [Myxococcota bacterium]|nr:PqqD family protein [Myxococcota bacterium]